MMFFGKKLILKKKKYKIKLIILIIRNYMNIKKYKKKLKKKVAVKVFFKNKKNLVFTIFSFNKNTNAKILSTKKAPKIYLKLKTACCFFKIIFNLNDVKTIYAYQSVRQTLLLESHLYLYQQFLH